MASAHGDRPIVPRIPFTAPTWLKGDRLLFAAAGYVAATAAPLSVAALHAQSPVLFEYLEPQHVLVPALLSGVVLAWMVLNTRTVLGAVGCALIGGPPAGAIAAWLTAVYLTGVSQRGIMIGGSALLGIPFGAVFGAVFAWPAAMVALIRSQRAHDGFDRVLSAIGTWLLAIYGTIALVGGESALELVARVGILLGAALLGAGLLRRAARGLWIRRVRSGKQLGWSLREWDGIEGVAQLAPLFGAQRLTCDSVLVRTRDAAGNPYRGARPEIAVALAPGPPTLTELEGVNRAGGQRAG
jgi:hypothetical protein